MPSPYGQGQKLCDRQGGNILFGGGSYTCSKLGGFTDREYSQAERLCLRTGNGGVFVPSFWVYDCYFS